MISMGWTKFTAMIEAAAPQKISSQIFLVADMVAILADSPAIAARAADGFN